MNNNNENPVSRRSLLKLIGATGGSALMYETMVGDGLCGTSDFNGPIKLSGDVKGASVLVLGAGLAGMTAAYELRKAGYKVQVLEYNDRPGGRNWSLYGGDTYTEMGGVTQNVQFDKGLYFNPGPWRIPYHHHGILHYCKLLERDVGNFRHGQLQRLYPFDQSVWRQAQAPSRDRDGFRRLCCRAAGQGHQPGQAGWRARQGREGRLLQMLRAGARWTRITNTRKATWPANMRGYRPSDPGGGLAPAAGRFRSLPMKICSTRACGSRSICRQDYDFQSQLFQPVGGMGMIGKAFGKQLDGVIKYNCKVTNIQQDDKGVTATYIDTKKGGAPQTAHADWCVCTIPASVLSQIPMNVGAPMKNAINSLSYEFGLQGGTAVQAPLLGRG